jgi:hypothetical protein
MNEHAETIADAAEASADPLRTTLAGVAGVAVTHAPGSGLVALLPAERARQVLAFDARKAELAKLAADTVRILTITNADGREECHQAAMRLKRTRVAIQKVGKEAREDATAFSKAVIAAEGELVAVIEPEEERLFQLRDAWDAEAEAAKLREAEARRAAEEAERARVQALRDFPATLARSSAAEIEAGLQQLAAWDLAGLEGDALGAAETAQEAARLRLADYLADAQARETREAQAAAQREAERQELEALREQQAAAQRQLEEAQAQARAAQEAADRAQREAAEALAAAQRQAQEAEAAAERERQAREQAERDAQAAQERAAAAAAEARQRAERERQEAAQRAQDAAEAEARRQAEEAERERLRLEEEAAAAERKAREEREAAERRERTHAEREAAISAATLPSAAGDALELLRGVLGGLSPSLECVALVADKLEAALARQAVTP